MSVVKNISIFKPATSNVIPTKTERRIIFEQLQKNSSISKYHFDNFQQLEEDLLNEIGYSSNIPALLIKNIMQNMQPIVKKPTSKEFSIAVQLNLPIHVKNKELQDHQIIASNEKMDIIGITFSSTQTYISHATLKTIAQTAHIKDRINTGNYSVYSWHHRITNWRNVIDKNYFQSNLDGISLNPLTAIVMFVKKEQVIESLKLLKQYLQYVHNYYVSNVHFMDNYITQITKHTHLKKYVDTDSSVVLKSPILKMISDVYANNMKSKNRIVLLYDIMYGNLWKVYQFAKIFGVGHPKVANLIELEIDRQKKNKIQRKNAVNSARAKKILYMKKAISFKLFNTHDLKKNSDKEREIIDLTYKKNVNHDNILKNNKCVHLQLLKSVMRSTSSSFKFDTHAWNELKAIVPRDKDNKTSLISCNVCKLLVLCPHHYTLFEFYKNDNNKNVTNSALRKILLHQYADKLPVKDSYYCKICGELIVKKFMEKHAKFIQGERVQITREVNTLNNIIWKEVRKIINNNIQFNVATDVNILTSNISDIIFPFIEDEQEGVEKNLTSSHDIMQANLYLFINIYAFASLTRLISHYPNDVNFKKNFSGFDKPGSDRKKGGGKSKYKGIDINKYPDNVIFQAPNKIKKWFPHTPNQLYIVKESIFSITHKDVADALTKHILEYGKFDTITDATSNVGGNCISFAKKFKQVNAVEKNKITCGALRKNIDAYDFNNVTIFCNSYLDIINQLQQDVVFIDPPWGGPDYRKHDKLMLYLDKRPIYEVVNMINRVKLIVLKCPCNFNFSVFEEKVNMQISKKKYHGYFMLFIRPLIQGANDRAHVDIRMLQNIIKTSIITIVSTKRTLIDKIPYMSASTIKPLVIKAYKKISKMYVKMDTFNTELPPEYVANSPVYSYLYHIKKKTTPSLKFSDIRSILGVDLIDIKNMSHMLDKLVIPKKWNPVVVGKSPTQLSIDYSKYAYASFLHFIKYVKNGLYRTPVFGSVEHQAHAAEYMKIRTVERKILEYFEKKAKTSVFHYYHERYGGYNFKNINLLKIFCSDGQRHNFNIHVFEKGLTRIEIPKKDIANWMFNAEKNKEFKQLKKVDLKCSLCKVFMSTATDVYTDIANVLNVNDDIKSFYNLYVFKCPVKNLHTFQNDKCTQCKVTKNMIFIKDRKYYEMYKSKFHQEIKAREKKVKTPPVLPKLTNKNDQAKKWEITDNAVHELSKLTKTPESFFNNIGLLENVDFDKVYSGQIVSAAVPDSYNRIVHLQSYLHALFIEYEMLKNGKAKSIQLKTIIEKWKNIDFSTFPNISFNVYNAYSKYKNTNNRTHVNYLLHSIASSLLEIAHHSTETNIAAAAVDFVMYYTKVIINTEKSFSAPGVLRGKWLAIDDGDVDDAVEENYTGKDLDDVEYDPFSLESTGINTSEMNDNTTTGDD